MKGNSIYNCKVGDKIYFLTWRGSEDYSVSGAAKVLGGARNRVLVRLDAEPKDKRYVRYCDVFPSLWEAEIGGRRVVIKVLEDKLAARNKRLKRLQAQVVRAESRCSEIRERIRKLKKSIYED